MTNRDPTVFDPQQLRNEALQEGVEKLSRIGVRMTFPEHVVAAQEAWPEDSPLSEEELRAELLACKERLVVEHRKMKDLYDRLPEPAEFRLEDETDVPPSVYLDLCGTVVGVVEDHLDGALKEIDQGLDATPEELRQEWLARRLPHGPWHRLVAGYEDTVEPE